ncbi:MAG: methylenetetrahydrofolate reductase [Coriobacteriia bacterium]|nr:methylenetetrahydrofolate reductase [Coriobacteriia bacterium]
MDTQTTSTTAAAPKGQRRIANIYSAFQTLGKPVFSFEIFPPKGDLTQEQAADVGGQLAQLYPDFISVTFSAGGSGSHGRAADATVSVAQLLQDQFGVPALAHLTCANTTREHLDAVCEDMKARGIENVLALRGDLREDSELHEFRLAVDLIAYLKDKGFCVGAAAYPEGHIDCADPRANIDHLKSKQDAGADFFVTQLFFQNSYAYAFLDEARARGVTLPISFGVMPFMSKSQVQRMVFMCGASLPSPIVKILAHYENDPVALEQAGVEYACRQLVDLAAHGVDGLHVYTMNRPAVARAVKQELDAASLVRG